MYADMSIGKSHRPTRVAVLNDRGRARRHMSSATCMSTSMLKKIMTISACMPSCPAFPHAVQGIRAGMRDELARVDGLGRGLGGVGPEVRRGGGGGGRLAWGEGYCGVETDQRALSCMPPSASA